MTSEFEKAVEAGADIFWDVFNEDEPATVTVEAVLRAALPILGEAFEHIVEAVRDKDISGTHPAYQAGHEVAAGRIWLAQLAALAKMLEE